jgi:hypothetical protein
MEFSCRSLKMLNNHDLLAFSITAVYQESN